MITLRKLIKRYPKLFYPQVWYDGESFMDETLPENAPTEAPDGRNYVGAPPELIMWHQTGAVPAVVLAALYIENPNDPMWQGYLWTSDFDDQGQRVYVGSNGKGLEIHRHLKITARWGVPSWG